MSDKWNESDSLLDTMRLATLERDQKHAEVAAENIKIPREGLSKGDISI